MRRAPWVIVVPHPPSTSRREPTLIEKSVLIIDDEKRMTDSLRDLLTAHGCKVETANSGAEGIQALERNRYPVVVTDLRMQGVDGLNVIRHVHEHLPKTLVIVITGYASTESAIEALHYRAFDYLTKPFEFDSFKAAIDRAFHKLEVDQLREDTAAMITHDIKVPLTSILGFAAMMYDRRSEEFHPRAAEFADTIRSNAQKVLAIVENYLTTCKIDADNLIVNPTRVVIRHMIEDLLSMIEIEAEKRGFSIEVQIEESPESAVFDESHVYRAVGNLLQNAIKYGDPSEPIRLRVHALTGERSPLEGPSIKIEVVNRAHAVTPESLQGVFGRFKRATADSGIEGSGIGLYVVDAVARAHGGLPEAQCLEGGFVSFSIVLPLGEKTA